MGSSETDSVHLYVQCVCCSAGHAEADCCGLLLESKYMFVKGPINYWKGCIMLGHGLLHCSCSLGQRGAKGKGRKKRARKEKDGV